MSVTFRISELCSFCPVCGKNWKNLWALSTLSFYIITECGMALLQCVEIPFDFSNSYWVFDAWAFHVKSCFFRFKQCFLVLLSLRACFLHPLEKFEPDLKLWFLRSLEICCFNRVPDPFFYSYSSLLAALQPLVYHWFYRFEVLSWSSFFSLRIVSKNSKSCALYFKCCAFQSLSFLHHPPTVILVKLCALWKVFSVMTLLSERARIFDNWRNLFMHCQFLLTGS